MAAVTGVGRGPAPERLRSLDAFRGLAIAGMILVNNPGSWAHVYPPLLHATWHGATPTDLVFPFFLFAIGVAMSFSFAARAARGDTRSRLLRHVATRALLLYGLGFLGAAWPGFDLATVRLAGVLARIAIVYLVAGTLVLFLLRRAIFAAMLALLFVYWALMTLVPVPGFGAGDLSAEGNLASWLDRLVLGAHMWSGGGGVYDPEGLLSTLPAVSSTLAGLFVGDYLRSGGAETMRILGLGLVLILLGHAWDVVLPINKPIWTSSYVAYTTGWALVALGVLYWIVDVRGWRGWTRPLVVYGKNAITVFVASGLVAKGLVLWRLTGRGGEPTSAYNLIYETAFASWAGPLNGSLAFAVAMVLLWLGVAWAMYARRIFLKV